MWCLYSVVEVFLTWVEKLHVHFDRTRFQLVSDFFPIDYDKGVMEQGGVMGVVGWAFLMPLPNPSIVALLHIKKFPLYITIFTVASSLP